MNDPASAALPEQMELIDECHLPVRVDLEQLARERSFIPDKPEKVFSHSGKIVIKRLKSDQDLLEAICSALVLGLSARLIGKRFGLSPRSVVNIREAMTERGELASVRLRVLRKLDRVIEDGLDRWHEGIVNGEIHPGQIPIPVLAALDKKGQMEAHIVPGTSRTVEEISVERVLAAREALRMLAAPDADPTPTEISSVVCVRKPLIDKGNDQLDPAFDPSDPATDPAPPPPPPDPPGGGVRFAAPRPGLDGKALENP